MVFAAKGWGGGRQGMEIDLVAALYRLAEIGVQEVSDALSRAFNIQSINEVLDAAWGAKPEVRRALHETNWERCLSSARGRCQQLGIDINEIKDPSGTYVGRFVDDSIKADPVAPCKKCVHMFQSHPKPLNYKCIVEDCPCNKFKPL